MMRQCLSGAVFAGALLAQAAEVASVSPSASHPPPATPIQHRVVVLDPVRGTALAAPPGTRSPSSAAAAS